MIWTITLRGGPLAEDEPATLDVEFDELPAKLPALPGGEYRRDPGHGLAYDWVPGEAKDA